MDGGGGFATAAARSVYSAELSLEWNSGLDAQSELYSNVMAGSDP
jgi:hypothetical protein